MTGSVLAIVPARGGSKGVPGKNVRPLAGRPLVEYTARAAADSGVIDRIVLSTDSPEIAEVGRRAGLEVPFLRPAALSADDTPMLPVLQHALDVLEQGGWTPEIVVLLQPTSPLRTAAHIDAAVTLLEASGADAVVSVVEVPHRFNPVSVLRMDGDRVAPWSPGPAVTRRQDKPRLFARNGPAVLAVRTRVLVEERRLYGQDTRAISMTDAESVDIDTAWDLAVAELALARRLARL